MRGKLAVSVSGRLTEEAFEELERWRLCALLGRSRSDVIGRILETVISLLRGSNESLERICRRLNLSPA